MFIYLARRSYVTNLRSQSKCISFPSRQLPRQRGEPLDETDRRGPSFSKCASQPFTLKLYLRLAFRWQLRLAAYSSYSHWWDGIRRSGKQSRVVEHHPRSYSSRWVYVDSSFENGGRLPPPASPAGAEWGLWHIESTYRHRAAEPAAWLFKSARQCQQGRERNCWQDPRKGNLGDVESTKGNQPDT